MALKVRSRCCAKSEFLVARAHKRLVVFEPTHFPSIYTAGASIADAGASPPHPHSLLLLFRWRPASGSAPEDT